MSSQRTSFFREVNAEREAEFVNRGFKKVHFFPHRIYYLPKCGPDAFKLAGRMCGNVGLHQLWEIVLYALPPLIDEFPHNLFFDPDIIWHQQQFGRPGQVATANLVVMGNSLRSNAHVSDLVQRISRRREHKTRVEKKFMGWNYLLLNSIMNFAQERNLNPVFLPTADLALRNTDPERIVYRELFERIYDRTVQQLYECKRNKEWWVVDIRQNRGRLVAPEKKSETLAHEKMICLCHDIERGLGHRDVESSFARHVDGVSPRYLDDMLRAEEEENVKATYHVVGSILPEVRADIESGGHCIGFHSYDHRVGRTLPGWRWVRRLFPRMMDSDQLPRCRDVDYRIKGYRPPKSRITSELSDVNLCFHNFEWLASSAYSLQLPAPELRNGLVKIPILFDDFEMYRSRMRYEDWEKDAIVRIQQAQFAAFSMHDCYAGFWLPHYKQFLQRITGLGRLCTLDEVAGRMALSSAE
jgi:peptidoglycan/xylan/chitin deacetylase (PgdA/CDA1 family)